MNVSEEVLMAYVDGELDPQARAAVERAMVADPDIASRIARHRSLRSALRSAYAPVLDEPVPERLITAARTAPTESPRSPVAPLRAARPANARPWTVREWTAMAASLVIGAVVSALVLRSFNTAPVSERGGRLIASGLLAGALSAQLASKPSPGAPVGIGLTFLSKSGDYCRTFTLRGSSPLAGLACRDREAWRIEVLARSAPPTPGGGPYRPAASPIPQAVLQTAAAEMVGEPLDARAEAAALARGWSR